MVQQRLKNYQALADFIAELQGPDAEVVLYDLDDGRAIYAVNPLEDMQVGNEMREQERNFLDQKIYEHQDYIVNYRALSKMKHKLKSATFFLKGEDGNLEAVMTVNIKVDKYIELREMINIMIRGQHPDDRDPDDTYGDYFGKLSFLELMQKTILEELAKFDAAPNRLSYQERIQLMESLHRKGVFNVKGSITELARLMDTTETSIYRYINKL